MLSVALWDVPPELSEAMPRDMERLLALLDSFEFGPVSPAADPFARQAEQRIRGQAWNARVLYEAGRGEPDEERGEILLARAYREVLGLVAELEDYRLRPVSALLRQPGFWTAAAAGDEFQALMEDLARETESYFQASTRHLQEAVACLQAGDFEAAGRELRWAQLHSGRGMANLSAAGGES